MLKLKHNNDTNYREDYMNRRSDFALRQARFMHELMVAEPVDATYNLRLAEEGRKLLELHIALKAKEDRNEDTTTILNLDDVGDVVPQPCPVVTNKRSQRYDKPIQYGRITLGWK